MKLLLLLFCSLVFVSGTCIAQSKKDTVLTIIIPKEDASKFLTIFQVGINSLMSTAIPANQVNELNAYGTALFQKQLAIYQSWFPKVEPPKKDTATKKP